jgi:hypothetical protein
LFRFARNDDDGELRIAVKPADVCIAAVIWGLALVASRRALDEFSPELMLTQASPTGIVSMLALGGIAVMLLARRARVLSEVAGA